MMGFWELDPAEREVLLFMRRAMRRYRMWCLTWEEISVVIAQEIAAFEQNIDERPLTLLLMSRDGQFLFLSAVSSLSKKGIFIETVWKGQLTYRLDYRFRPCIRRPLPKG